MLWPAIGVLVFGIWIFIASAVGLSKAPKLEEGLNKMRCAVISIFDDFVHGSMLSDWKGLAGFKENLKN